MLVLVVLFVVGLGVFAFSRTRKIRAKPKPRRRWHETPHRFHAFERSELPGRAAWVTSCNREYVPGVRKLHRSMRNVGSAFPSYVSARTRRLSSRNER